MSDIPVRTRLKQKVAVSEVRQGKRPRVLRVARVAIRTSAQSGDPKKPMTHWLRRPLQASFVDPSLDVPVDCGEAGEWETVEAAVAQGAHRSATSTESKEDVAYQVQAGYANWATATSRRKYVLYC
jgi:hypothetical protein